MLRSLVRRLGRADAASLSPVARLCRVTVLFGVAVIALHTFSRWWAATVWDDAFIFQRYATNLLAGHGVAFNPEGAPTYGLTSLLYLLPVAAVRLGWHDPALAALVTSCLCAAAAVMLLLRLAYNAAERGTTGWFAAAAVAVVIAAPTSAEHVVSGMDTWFGVAYLAALLWALHRQAENPETWGRVGVMSGLAMWVRPELVAFGALTAAATVLGPTGRAQRHHGLKLGLTIVATVAALMLGAWAYFGVPLPLPFFTKASGIYGEGFMQVYRGRGLLELGTFFAQVWPLILPVALEGALSPRNWWKRSSASERGIAAASLVLLVFHAAFALPIMGTHARFFQPVLPALVYLAACSLARLRERIEHEQARLWLVAVFGATIIMWTQLLPTAGSAVKSAGERAAHPTGVSARRLVRETGPQRYWPGLAALPELPPLTVAATEVGFIGVVAPDSTIVDIAGLNTKAFAFGPFDVDHLVAQAPDLVYLPHPDYKDMVKAIDRHRAFQDQYLVLNRHVVGGSHYGVAIRRDGPHAELLWSAVRHGSLGPSAKHASR